VTNYDTSLFLLETFSQKLKKYLTRLETALLKCQQIRLHQDLSDDDLAAFEGLTACFARSADIFLNQAEKQNIISSLAAWMEVRELRKKIAHGYEEDDPLRIFQSVLLEAPAPLSIRSSLK
jgi:hypothetical protein